MRFLVRLYLSDNQINDVGRGTFGPVTRIGTIDLARNFIKKIDFQMFNQLQFAEVCALFFLFVQIHKEGKMKTLIESKIGLLFFPADRRVRKLRDGDRKAIVQGSLLGEDQSVSQRDIKDRDRSFRELRQHHRIGYESQQAGEYFQTLVRQCNLRHGASTELQSVHRPESGVSFGRRVKLENVPREFPSEMIILTISGSAAQYDRAESSQRVAQFDALGATSNVPEAVRAAHDRSVLQQSDRDPQCRISDSVQPSFLKSVAQFSREDKAVHVWSVANAVGVGHELQSVERCRTRQFNQITKLQVINYILSRFFEVQIHLSEN